MSIKTFLRSKTFFMHLIAAVVVTIVLLYATISVLKNYTDHGEKLTVPDLSGVTFVQAQKMISKSEFRCQVTDSLYQKDTKPGTIIGQIPTAGSQVKKNRLIYLTVCTASPEQVVMPRLTDIAYRQALNILESLGLEVGKVDYKSSEYSNLVLEQKVYGEPAEEGMHIPKGTKIDLTVGQISSEGQIKIPYLLGESFSSVKDTIEEMSLELGSVIYDDSFTTEEDSMSAMVWKQHPEASGNHKMFKGQSVDVWLTIDPGKITKAFQDK